MPRIGLPATAKPKSAAAARTSSRPAPAPRLMIEVALGAIAFRVISVLVAAFCARVFPTTAAAEPASSDFGIYPFLTREVGHWIGHWLFGPATPELAIAWLAFAAAMVMLVIVSQLDLDEEHSVGAVLLAVVFPFAFVFGMANADALFLLFTLAAFYGFRRGSWWMGGVAGALATATSPAGLFILPALAWTAWRSNGRTAGRVRTIAGLVLAAAGIGGYMVYLYYRGGPVGGWAAAMDRWGFHISQAPWTPVRLLLTAHLAPADALNGVIALICLIGVPVVWWRFDAGYALYMLGILWMPLVSGKFDGLGRACALLFPVFLLIAGIRWRTVVMAVTIASAMFYALALAMFA